MDGLQAIGTVALLTLAGIGLLTLGHCAFKGARQIERERRYGEVHLREDAALERIVNPTGSHT